MLLHHKEEFVKTQALTKLKVADEVWIAVALLHREHLRLPIFPLKKSLTVLGGKASTNLFVPGSTFTSSCIASPIARRTRAATVCLSKRRRAADASFAEEMPIIRTAQTQKSVRNPRICPLGYVDLLDWYRDWSIAASRSLVEADPLLQARGSGKHLWADEHADEYVRRLREGWE